LDTGEEVLGRRAAEIDVSIVVHHDGRIDLEGDELKLAMWNHDPHRLRDAVD
jgi:hypothetical protein